MRLFTPFLLLTWCPWLVLGDVSVVVQTSGGQLKPGQVLTYVVSASPLPAQALGMVLIGVSVPGQTGGRVFWPWTITMDHSPKQGSITIPSGVPPKFYSVDVHANSSVYSPLLATSNAFEIVVNAPPPPTTQPTTNIVQTTKQTTTMQVVITTTQSQTVIQPPPPPNTPVDPTTRQTVNKPDTPTTNTPASTPASTTGTSSKPADSTNAIFTPSSQSVAVTPVSDAPPTPTSDTVFDAPTQEKKSSSIGPAIGGAVAGILIILLILFFWRRYNKKRRERIDIDEMAESNARYRDAEGAAAAAATGTVATSPFANTFREFTPNRNHTTTVSPFLLDSERSEGPSSPEPQMTSKFREAYGGGAGPTGGQTHHHNNSFGASTGYFESTSGSGPETSEQLLQERELALGEISVLRSRGGQGSSGYAQSSVSAGSSGGRDGGDEEMRNRLDMLTQHVHRLESALEQAVNVNSYDAPPTYHQAPSQRA